MSLKIFLIMTFLLQAVNARSAPAGSAASTAKDSVLTDKYAQKWIPFPALSLKGLLSEELEVRKTQKGRVLVVVFVASWCVPCQQLMPDFRRIENSYRDRYTDLVYVFAHDTLADARAFTSFYKIKQNAYLGTAKILEDFHQPDLPSIYVADRYGWLLYRKLNLKTNDFKELEGLLELHTSF